MKLKGGWRAEFGRIYWHIGDFIEKMDCNGGRGHFHFPQKICNMQCTFGEEIGMKRENGNSREKFEWKLRTKFIELEDESCRIFDGRQI